MGKQLFGTDGIRGVAGEYPLDPATVFAFGVALADDALRNHGSGESPRILIGADTRESGPWIAGMVAGGLASRGVACRLRGRHHHAGRGLLDAHRALLRRRDDFGLAQSVPRQRHQGLQPQRIQAAG